MTKSEQTKPSFSEEEGMYYERVMSPVKIRVIAIEHPKKRTWKQAQEGNIKLVLEDKKGQTMEVKGRRLVSRVLGYLQPFTNLSRSELKELPSSKLEAVVEKALGKSNKEIKGLYNGQGELCGVASNIHKQISWKQIRDILEKAMQEVCGQVVSPQGEGHPFKWNYQIPIKNKNVSAWVGVHAGNNIIHGRSGVHISSRWRTEREGSSGGVKRPACLNWCGMWQMPLNFFGINTKRLDNIYKVLGQENVEALKLAQYHIRPDMAKFAEKVKTQLATMVKAVEAMQVVIDKSIHSPLKRAEMEAILEAYSEKANLPNYVVKQILEHIEEETVWGFSQAVSWVRTHGEFKQFRICKPVEDRELTRKLENIAGEVLSLTPTINDFHKKVGDITLEKLLPKEAVQVTA